jgi:hypothetical protein
LCANCGNPFRDGDIYCSQCSQQVETHKLTVGHLLHELVHAVTHADKGLFVLIKELAIRPGIVAREYVEGKRKKYFNPFTFVLICLSIFVFINATFHVVDNQVKADPNILRQLPTAEAKEKYLQIMQRTAIMLNFFTKKSNLIYLLAIPLYATLMWLFFRRRSFAEHLVANMFFNGFLALLTSLILSPLLGVTQLKASTPLLMAFTFLIQIAYLSWANYGFLNMERRRSYFKIILAILTIVVVWLILSGTAAMYYVFGDNMITILKALLQKI